MQSMLDIIHGFVSVETMSQLAGQAQLDCRCNLND